jgi:hypothetical protein
MAKPAMQALTISFVACLPAVSAASPNGVNFSSPAAAIEAYDYVEIVATLDKPEAANPFLDASLSGTFQTADGSKKWNVDGFCDSADGSVFRIRFMPAQAGDYSYTVTYKQGSFQKTSTGTFDATDGHRKGMLADDPKYPWHFIWSGTGEHFFFNGTTAYWLVGWSEDHVIDYSLARLHRLKVNRLRVTISGREAITAFGEPVITGPNWTFLIAAWPAKDANDPLHPGFDYSRFNVSYWQRFDRMLRFARENDMNISLVLDMNDGIVHPVAGSEDETRFIRYAVNRFSAFSNITWDLGDDLDSYRDEKWTHDTGMLIQQLDPYKHLETSHPARSNTHQDRASSWFGFTSYQEWSRNQHALILDSRKLQEKTGRIIPQTNEEYGYEEHYPHWAAPGSDSADVLRRTAWDIVMAGGYQTSGESVKRGTNVWPDTGGGWMNGRGDDTQTMFLGYGHMVDFFTGFEWWKTNPHDELVTAGNYCLADPGKIYVIYLPHGGKTTVQMQKGIYKASLLNATTGESIDLPDVEDAPWTTPEEPNEFDWAILLEAK